MNEQMTLLDALVEQLVESSRVNASVQVKPAAVLWPDAVGEWLPVIALLRQRLAGLVSLGEYVPAAAQGPSIWIKCALAGLVPDIEPGAGPYVVYLPMVSRVNLRAIESCPRALQPLAELQYRGVFWSQSNGKDWTVNAFLISQNGGLGLNVSQDRATKEALGQALVAGVLLDRKLNELTTRHVNAEWLHSLFAPNPTRDVLVWLNEPAAAVARWGPVRWGVFTSRCKADFGFDPATDGVLAAAEKLAKGEGKWSAVAEIYRDSFSSFPNVYGVLAKVQPPQLDLFDDRNRLSGYPQVNESKEASLRYRLAAMGAMTADQARTAVQEAEAEHGLRRGWLWATMGSAPLAKALAPLAELASGTATLPAGGAPDLLAKSYRDEGWKVDAAAVAALGAVQAKADIDAMSAAVRALYLPWTEESAKRLQEAVKSVGGLTAQPPSMDANAPGTCTIFVDGLRYDAAQRLLARLASMGTAHIDAYWTSLPSVTASGKAWCSPVASSIGGTKADVEFQPRVTSNSRPLSSHSFRKLLLEQGIQVLDSHELGDPAGCAWTEAGDLDHYGHAHGIRLARDMDVQLQQVSERVVELQQAGWKKLRIVTDHGWLLMPGGLPKSELPKHQTETRWGRCAVLKDTAHGSALTFGWSWCAEVQVAYAPGASSFVAGSEYAHGGLSLQECLVPVVTLDIATPGQTAATATILSITWKGLRCTVVVDSLASGLTVGIRKKAAVATNPVAAPKPLQNGKASLAVADDELLGTVVFVVVLAADGEIVQKATTTVGE